LIFFKNTDNCTSVLLILFLLLNRFFKGKLKSGFFGGFYCFFKWALKKPGWFFWLVFYNNPGYKTTKDILNFSKRIGFGLDDYQF